MPDPITKTLFENLPLLYGNFGGFQVAKIGLHSLFDPGLVRVNMAAGADQGNGLRPVTATANAAGDTIYLSYFTNEISSVLLADPPPAGARKFTTDNLSGCKIFVDKVGATNNLILYHANARAQSPPANQGAVQPSTETAGAANTLNTLHANAMPDYAAAPHNLAGLATVGSVNKPTYNQNANNLVQHKTNQHRLRIPNANEQPDPNRVNAPEWVGGTVVFGFYVIGSGWEIYYQTWGAVEYRRPKFALHAIRTKGRDKVANNFRLVQVGRLYPAPFNRNV